MSREDVGRAGRKLHLWDAKIRDRVRGRRLTQPYHEHEVLDPIKPSFCERESPERGCEKEESLIKTSKRAPTIRDAQFLAWLYVRIAGLLRNHE